jgi:hypothetical protein
MNASDLTFGIEIETTISPTTAGINGLRVGTYYDGIQVPYLPAGWVAKHDGSIHGENGRIGCEIVSPVLKGAEGLAHAEDVCRILEEKGHRVNATCGVHVHVGWNPQTPSSALARLISIVSSVEKGLYAITGTKSRERGVYCGGVRKYGNDKEAKKNLDANRYHALNLTNLASGRKNTVEFRAFSGSLNAIKIIGWVQVCLGLVQKALNGSKKAPWSPKPWKCSMTDAGKLGEMETERLLMVLGWFDYEPIHYGWISDNIPRKAVRAEFRRLAKKYDSMI